jgi:hypothetical protein
MAPALQPSGIDLTRAPCPEGQLSLRARGTALVDLPEFYGTLAASLLVDWRIRLLPRLEVSVGGRAIDYRFAQNAVVSEDELAAGPLTLGAVGRLDRRAFLGRPIVLGWALRADLPYTDTGYDVPVLAASPQLLAALAIGRRLVAHARLAGLLWLARPPSDIDTRRAVALSTDWSLSAFSPVAVGLGAEAQSGWYGFGLDHLLLRGGFRTSLGARTRLDLTALVPVLGEERTDLALELGLAVDLH